MANQTRTKPNRTKHLPTKLRKEKQKIKVTEDRKERKDNTKHPYKKTANAETNKSIFQ